MRQMLSGNHKLAVFIGLCALLLLLSIALVGVSIHQAVGQGDARAQQSRETDRRICRALNEYNHAFTLQLRRAQKTLPTLAYFRAHPDELANQQKEITHELAVFQQRRC